LMDRIAEKKTNQVFERRHWQHSKQFQLAMLLYNLGDSSEKKTNDSHVAELKVI